MYANACLEASGNIDNPKVLKEVMSERSSVASAL